MHQAADCTLGGIGGGFSHVRKLFLLFLVVLACSLAPVMAGTICPGVSGNPIADASGCNTIITITDGGSTAVTVDLSPYDTSDDQLVGIVNNSSSVLNSLPLSGANIFGFEGDGICAGFIASSF